MKIQIPKLKFSLWIGYYNAWPSLKLGTNYWCFEIAVGSFYFETKLDFWNPRKSDGWIITKTPQGTRSVHAKHYTPYSKDKYPTELILFN